MVFVIVRGHAHKTSDQANNEVAFRMHRFTGTKSHIDAGKDQENSEDDRDPTESHERGSKHDEERPENQRTQDSEKQDAMLVLTRHGEVAEDEYENENIVDR